MRLVSNLLFSVYGIFKGIAQNVLVIVLMQNYTLIAFLVFITLIIIHTSVINRGIKSHSGALGFILGFSATLILFMDKLAIYLGY